MGSALVEFVAGDTMNLCRQTVHHYFVFCCAKLVQQFPPKILWQASPRPAAGQNNLALPGVLVQKLPSQRATIEL
jgi:hypothetical protein